MYEISREGIKILNYLLKKKKGVQNHSKALMCISFLHYFLEPVNAYIKLYGLSPRAGELLHSIETK